MVISLKKPPVVECGASWGANTWETSINKGSYTDYSATHHATPATVPVDMMATLKDASTTTDQDDEGEEPVKNQAELVTLEEYYV